jgi:hypothetical protein
MSGQIQAVSRESEEDFESRPALPPAGFDFLIYSLRLRTESDPGFLPFSSPEEQRAIDDSLAEFRFRFVQIQDEESKPE